MHTLYKEKIAVKIGQNGISQGKIAKDAFKRAVHALKVFKTVIDQFEVTHIKGVATSAIRNARNGQALLEKIVSETGIVIDVITGDQEAELIYYGVKAAEVLDHRPQLMMDIGGGSVEFIIGDEQKILWKQSFEIGGQRLIDGFHNIDPIPERAIQALEEWLEKRLKPLIQAMETHLPAGLIGCSGTFDTICEIHRAKQGGDSGPLMKSFVIPQDSFHAIHQEFISKSRKERLDIPGMVSMRVDMIVVASCLIKFVLDRLGMKHITACSYALKEGVLFFNHQQTAISDQ